MSKTDIISKEELEKLYIVEGKCYREIADLFNTDYYTIRNASMKYKLNVKKGGTNLRKESSKRGVNYLYGVDNVGQLDSTKEKIKNTSLERYGIKNPGSTSSARLKAKKTAFAKYGEGNMRDPEKVKKIIQDKYGVDYSIMLAEPTHTANSKINLQCAEYLDLLNVNYEREFCLNSYKYDFKIGKYLIELNPFPTHNSTWGPYNNPKDKYYHFNKSKNAIDNGFVCVHIWDWDNLEQVIDACLNDSIIIGNQQEPNKIIFNIKSLLISDINIDRDLANNEVIIYDSGEEKCVSTSKFSE